MCRIEDADQWAFYHEEMRKARKAYRCGECGRAIAPRERYHYAMGRLGGDVYTYRTCQHCHVAASWLQIVCSGWLYEAVLEELVEHWQEEPELRSLSLARLIAGMRHQWFDGRAAIPDPDYIAATIPRSAHALAH